MASAAAEFATAVLVDRISYHGCCYLPQQRVWLSEKHKKESGTETKTGEESKTVIMAPPHPPFLLWQVGHKVPRN